MGLTSVGRRQGGKQLKAEARSAPTGVGGSHKINRASIGQRDKSGRQEVSLLPLPPPLSRRESLFPGSGGREAIGGHKETEQEGEDEKREGNGVTCRSAPPRKYEKSGETY